MMKRIAVVLLVHIALLSAAVSVDGATRPKFRPAASSGAGDGRYLVTLSEEAATDDPVALGRELALIYGAKLEVNASSDARQFAVTMTSARAQLLSTDPRVIEVAEVPLTTSAPLETPPATVSSVRLKPRSSGFGDNGQSGTYTYDGAGNITAIGADTFVYDSTQRLVSSVTRGVQEDYTYDAFGNRTSATGAVNCLGQTTCAQTVTVDSNTNHLTTINGAAVTYDAGGNIKTIAATSGSPGATYSYDGSGMMTEATVGSDVRQFIYTADDERIAVKQGASWTWTIRDQSGKVLREFTSLESGPNFTMTDWHWAKDYVWRDGLLLATASPSGTLHYHLDHLGTPRLITDSNGVKVAEHAYYPFGAEINLTPHENPEEAMKFTGHERDIVAGDGHTLDYMHARYDNASLGRFLSVDPVISTRAPHSPQMWNRYAYVGNSPMNRTDPTGEDIVLTGCQNGGGKSQACQEQTAIAQQSFGKAWQYVNNNNGVLTLKSGVSPAMLGSKFGVAARALGFMANSKDHFNLITGHTAAAMAKEYGGGRTIANAGGGASIYIDTNRFPQTLGMAYMGAAEVFVHETGHAIEPYFASAQAINAKYGMTGPAAKESFSVFLENAYRWQELGLPNNDVRMYYKRAGDILYNGTHLEEIWP